MVLLLDCGFYNISVGVINGVAGLSSLLAYIVVNAANFPQKVSVIIFT